MKRLLFVIPAFGIGGTNTSLVSLLAYVDRTQYDIYIYALNPVGSMVEEIAKYGTVLNAIDTGSQLSSSSNRSVSIVKSLLREIKHLFDKIGVDLKQIVYRKQVKSLETLSFDCVIAFQEGEATRFVQYFRHTKTVAWVRSDYARYLSILKSKPEITLYSTYDVIVNVSESALNRFLKVLPQFEEKSIFIYNLVDRNRIISLSNSKNVYVPNYPEFTIISLGRVDPVKHFNDIPQIARTLCDHGVAFHWIIIGGATVAYPEEYDRLKNDIYELGLTKHVEMLGHQTNPYPFLAKSNLLVCLSESETFNHTFAEARILGVPVLSVDYPGAFELLGNKKGGLIVNRNRICEMLEYIITDSKAYDSLRQETKSFSFDNDGQIKKIMEFVFNNKNSTNEE